MIRRPPTSRTSSPASRCWTSSGSGGSSSPSSESSLASGSSATSSNSSSRSLSKSSVCCSSSRSSPLSSIVLPPFDRPGSPVGVPLLEETVIGHRLHARDRRGEFDPDERNLRDGNDHVRADDRSVAEQNVENVDERILVFSGFISRLFVSLGLARTRTAATAR